MSMSGQTLNARLVYFSEILRDGRMGSNPIRNFYVDTTRADICYL